MYIRAVLSRIWMYILDRREERFFFQKENMEIEDYTFCRPGMNVEITMDFKSNWMKFGWHLEGATGGRGSSLEI